MSRNYTVIYVQLFVTSWAVYSPRNSPGQNTGVGSFSLLQGIFPVQGSNPGLPHCRQILHQLSHKGSPRILDWVTYHFSSGSSRYRNWTRVSCIAGGFFTNWAIRKAHTQQALGNHERILEEGKEKKKSRKRSPFWGTNKGTTYSLRSNILCFYKSTLNTKMSLKDLKPVVPRG